MREAFWTGFILTGMIHGLDYRMWTVKSAKDLLWGHQEKLFDIARHTMPDPPPFNQFGFFLTKNSTKEEDLGLYTMYTGEGDPYKLATIAAFNGKNNLGRWNDSDCDKVHGSDGASFNPYIQQKDTLWFFNDQLCRAMPLVFEEEVDREGLPGYRYRPREDVFMSHRFPDENSCYGVEGSVLGDGVFDVTTCQFNAPIVLSWPHFLHAEDKFRDEVQGLRPNVKEHGFWFDIQPTTGTTLSAKARIQINVMVRSSTIFDDLANVNDTVVPVLWFEEGIDKLGEDIVKVLKTAAVDPAIYRQYILYFFIVLMSCVLLLLLTAMCLCCSNRTSVAKVEKVREQVHDMLGPSSYDTEQAVQPFLESTDSSRTNSACHSRNCSEGTRPPYILTEGKSDKLFDILHINRALPYNTMQEVKLTVPENLLEGGVVTEREEGVEDLHSLPEEDEDDDEHEDEVEEEDEDDEDSEEEEDGGEPTDILILPRPRKISLSFSS
ncbi:platelet glycoprotein 4 [Eurytemora carolleeae]|uniref:platelet glycoprotein 4 n=1 Tax=Eurytemora carolleeae TaxID=1294199 RepID=UPI000C7843EB|nr:platelet glycoprotein 4 [Eurytemora carolleeae]|eukprot:XP_023340658.1 platelet glycoprotein 4-like [Eurytemora affinis]